MRSSSAAQSVRSGRLVLRKVCELVSRMRAESCPGVRFRTMVLSTLALRADADRAIGLPEEELWGQQRVKHRFEVSLIKEITNKQTNKQTNKRTN